MCTDLKDGRGKLCAGQTRVVSLDSSLVIPFEFISSENFGLALPIGSRNGKYGQPSKNSIPLFVFECWNAMNPSENI